MGTLLLSLPIAVADGNAVCFIDSLFTATAAVCVTGLVTAPTFAHWTLFGQIVIALLVQVGGLGIITFTMIFLILLRRRLGLKERLLIRDAYNLDTIQGMVSLVFEDFERHCPGGRDRCLVLYDGICSRIWHKWYLEKHF